MPTPDADIGRPTAHADGPNVITRVPVRCEIGQRQASMEWREAETWAHDVLRACGEARKHEYDKAAEGN